MEPRPLSCSRCLAPLDPRTEHGGVIACPYCGAAHQVQQTGALLLSADLRDSALPGWSMCDRRYLTFLPGPPPELVCRHGGEVAWLNVLGSNGTFDDFDVRATIRFLECQPPAKAGLQLRTRIDVGLYLVWIASGGTYSIMFLPWKGEPTTLVPWSASAALRKGLGVANQIRVVCQGPRIQVFFNGEHASTVRDDRLTFGWIRLLHAAPGAPSALAFSDIEVREALEAERVGAKTQDSPPGTGLVDVVLTSIDVRRKIMMIKLVREQTGLGLAEAKNLVEGTPRLLKSGLTPQAADVLYTSLHELGATAEVRPSEASPLKSGCDVVLAGFDPNRKIQLIKAVMDATGIGLAAAKALVEGAPKVVRSGLSDADAATLEKLLTASGGRVEVR